MKINADALIVDENWSIFNCEVSLSKLYFFIIENRATSTSNLNRLTANVPN